MSVSKRHRCICLFPVFIPCWVPLSGRGIAELFAAGASTSAPASLFLLHQWASGYIGSPQGPVAQLVRCCAGLLCHLLFGHALCGIADKRRLLVPEASAF